MEKRRLLAIPDLRASIKTGEMARKYGVTRQTIRRWRRRLNSGDGLQRRIAPGRTPKLKRGRLYLVYLGRRGRWTPAQFSRAIERQCGVPFHPTWAGRMLERFRQQEAGQ